jgi:hypothetical protein
MHGILHKMCLPGLTPAAFLRNDLGFIPVKTFIHPYILVHTGTMYILVHTSSYQYILVHTCMNFHVLSSTSKFWSHCELGFRGSHRDEAMLPEPSERYVPVVKSALRVRWMRIWTPILARRMRNFSNQGPTQRKWNRQLVSFYTYVPVYTHMYSYVPLLNYFLWLVSWSFWRSHWSYMLWMVPWQPFAVSSGSLSSSWA